MNNQICDLRNKTGEELLNAYNEIALETLKNIEDYKNKDKQEDKDIIDEKNT